MIVATKVKLYTAAKQRAILEKHLGSGRFAYNSFLEMKDKRYVTHRDAEKSSPNYLDKQDLLVKLKKQHAWLYEVNSQSLRMSLRFPDNAFKLKLKWKAEKYGWNMIEIGRFDPSSKLCSNCGSLKTGLKLSGRVYHCDVGGLVIDRDYNTQKYQEDGFDQSGAGAPRIFTSGDRHFGPVWAMPIRADVGR